jgi:hypothetical protein
MSDAIPLPDVVMQHIRELNEDWRAVAVAIGVEEEKFKTCLRRGRMDRQTFQLFENWWLAQKEDGFPIVTAWRLRVAWGRAVNSTVKHAASRLGVTQEMALSVLAARLRNEAIDPVKYRRPSSLIICVPADQEVAIDSQMRNLAIDPTAQAVDIPRIRERTRGFFTVREFGRKSNLHNAFRAIVRLRGQLRWAEQWHYNPSPAKGVHRELALLPADGCAAETVNLSDVEVLYVERRLCDDEIKPLERKIRSLEDEIGRLKKK